MKASELYNKEGSALHRMECPSGSIDGVGSDFEPFQINDLKMVDQTGASWNRVTSWLRQIDQLCRAA